MSEDICKYCSVYDGINDKNSLLNRTYLFYKYVYMLNLSMMSVSNIISSYE